MLGIYASIVRELSQKATCASQSHLHCLEHSVVNEGANLDLANPGLVLELHLKLHLLVHAHAVHVREDLLRHEVQEAECGVVVANDEVKRAEVGADDAHALPGVELFIHFVSDQH